MTDLPVHFFTIVRCGQPFIRWHLDQFKQLPFRWVWHCVEGVADLKHDTAWSVPAGGRAPIVGRDDGTLAYLNSIQGLHGDNGRVRLTSRCCGRKWDGKIEMVREPLRHINEPCLLVEVDSDELWTAAQLITMRDLFLENPEATAAIYRCHYFVGPDLVITNYEVYGNHDGEWRRTWLFKPGDTWERHEPPVLTRKHPISCARDNVANINPLGYDKTVPEDLVFQHFAYATEQQLKFKEGYYAYRGAVEAWKRLQAHKEFPCRLADFFPWVKDDAIVDRASAVGITPLIKC